MHGAIESRREAALKCLAFAVIDGWSPYGLGHPTFYVMRKRTRWWWRYRACTPEESNAIAFFDRQNISWDGRVIEHLSAAFGIVVFCAVVFLQLGR